MLFISLKLNIEFSFLLFLSYEGNKEDEVFYVIMNSISISFSISIAYSYSHFLYFSLLYFVLLFFTSLIYFHFE